MKLLSNTTVDAFEDTRFPYIVTFVDQRSLFGSFHPFLSFAVLWTSRRTVQRLRMQLVRKRCQRFLLNRMKCYQAINQTAVAQRWFQIGTRDCPLCHMQLRDESAFGIT